VFQIDEAVGELIDGCASNDQVLWDIGCERSCVGPPSNHRNGSIDSVKKLETESRPSPLIPERGVVKFVGSFRFESNLGRHGSASRRAVRSRTESQVSPAVSPAKTRRARRSISVAHAA
jgi:hypothetical protein